MSSTLALKRTPQLLLYVPGLELGAPIQVHRKTGGDVERLEEADHERVRHRQRAFAFWTYVIALAEDPDYFVTTLRALYNREPFAGFEHKPEFDMLGRTYSIGYEADLRVGKRISRHLAGEAGYGHFFAGDAIEESGPDEDIDFAYVSFEYTF